MTRRRPRHGTQSEFFKPIVGLIFLAAIWGGYKLGIIDAVARQIVEVGKPQGETNAGVIYRREMAKKSGQ